MSERKVAPGGEAKIEVKVNTAGRRGKLGKVVRIYSNDPKMPVASVAVEADIEVPGEPAGTVKPPQKPSRRPPLKKVIKAPAKS